MIDKNLSDTFREALDNMRGSKTVGWPVEQFAHAPQDTLTSINNLLALGAARLVNDNGTAYVILTDLAAEAMLSHLAEQN